MHIPDGFLDPKTWIGCSAITVAMLSAAVRRTKEKLAEKQVPLMGVMAAFIFAAQMINFPIIGGTSGHLVGGVLAAVLFGPFSASIIMTVILLIQCFLFNDGGVTALGANILNMGIIAPFLGYAVYNALRGVGNVIASFFAAWVSVVAAAAACALELAVSGTSPLGVALPAMLFWHLFIGVGEGVITAAVVGYLERVKSDLLTEIVKV
ncbi:MAG: energy-coupling factor ABC transporter permease [Thermoanaerobacteraceae bacterium]|nr:energy-coupling factor ABC transporter permease [Thermoanaerobacteraceae bacterium]